MPQQHGGDYCGQHLRDGERQPHAGRQQAREQPCRRQYEDQLTQQLHEQRLHTALGGLEHALYGNVCTCEHEADRQHAQTGHTQTHRACGQ